MKNGDTTDFTDFEFTSDIAPPPRKRGLRASTNAVHRTSLPPKTKYTTKPDTNRNRIRDQIAKSTQLKRENFLCAHSDLFLRVLPANNHVAKLLKTKREPLVPFRQLDSQPSQVKGVLKPYQLQGLSFLVHMYENGASAILGDEMGLGKTFQTLALFEYLLTNHPVPQDHYRPFLVVCPLSVLGSWITEATKFVPHLKLLRFHGSMNMRAQLKAELHDEHPDIVVTTYEAFQSEKGWFTSAAVWRYCVLDEGHKIKNEASDVSKALQSLTAEYRLLLTGTPVQNNLAEMWALLHWLYPDVFTGNTKELFTRSFDLGKGMVSETFMTDARRLLEFLMLRRTKQSPGVNLNLPQKNVVNLLLPLTPTQRQWYLNVLTRVDQSMLDGIFKGSVEGEKKILAAERSGETEQPGQNKQAWQRLMNLVMQLRQVCLHPYMIPGTLPDPYPGIDDHIRTGSAKFIALASLIDHHVIKTNEKILIFSGFTQALDWVEDLLVLKAGYDRKFSHTRLDGSTCKARRNLAIRTFQDMSSRDRVMLVSTRAGGLGLNLTAATVVVFMDTDWNPQVDLQAEARSHRIGQTKPVTVYKLCTHGTVEEQMLDRINKKLYLSIKITESMQNQFGDNRKRKADALIEDDVPNIGVSQLQSLIRRGAATINSDTVDIADWSFDDILAKCKEGVNSDVQDEAEWLAKAAQVECAVFDGVKYKRHNMAKDRPIELLDDRAARRVGKNTTVMIDGYEVSKNSVGCADWEAVPTYAGKDPTLAEYKKAKAPPIKNQNHCQVCHKARDLVNCVACPRAYHNACLTPQALSRKTMSGFRCPQHRCSVCDHTTVDAGGMLFRCRSCEKAYCETCIDFDEVKLLGDTLPELEDLDYGVSTQAHHVECGDCQPSRPSKRVKTEYHGDSQIKTEHSKLHSDRVKVEHIELLSD